MSDNGNPWPSIPLGELASEMCLGKMLDKQKNRGTPRPYLRNVNVRWFSFDLSDLKEMRFEEREGVRYGLQSGDLVICEGGEPGRAAVWKEQASDARIQKALHRVRFRSDRYDSSFAMYFLNYGTLTDAFAKHYTGTTIKHLTGKALAQVQFPLPPVTEQRRIVAKIEELFSDLDAGVAALERAKANLKRYRAAVLKAAVEGKLTEQWRADHPDVEPASELVKRILAERRKRWEAEQFAKYEANGKKPPMGWKDKYKEPGEPDVDGLPELPATWCWATIDCVSEFVRYGSSAKTNPDENGIPVLRMGNIQDGLLDLTQLKYLPVDHLEFPDLLLQSGDLLFNRTNSAELVGKSAVFQGFPDPCSYASYLIAARMLSGCDSRLVCSALNSAYGRRWVSTVVSQQVGQANVNGTKLRHFAFPLPPIAEQSQICESIEAISSVIEQSESDVSKALLRSARLRQSILKRAFEGKLVPRDPNDEPASELLARIKAGRAAAEANAKKTKKRTRRWQKTKAK